MRVAEYKAQDGRAFSPGEGRPGLRPMSPQRPQGSIHRRLDPRNVRHEPQFLAAPAIEIDQENESPPSAAVPHCVVFEELFRLLTFFLKAFAVRPSLGLIDWNVSPKCFARPISFVPIQTPCGQDLERQARPLRLPGTASNIRGGSFGSHLLAGEPEMMDNRRRLK